MLEALIHNCSFIYNEISQVYADLALLCENVNNK